MANRFPLVVDSSALQIKEIPAHDNLDLANNSIVNVVDITTSGSVTVGTTVTAEQAKIVSGGNTSFIKSTDTGIRFEDVNGDPIGLGKSFISITAPNADGIVYTTKANRNYLVNTSAGVVTTYLPNSVTPGDYIHIVDSSGSFGTNNLIILSNQSATGPATYIQGSLTSLEADVTLATVTLTYTGFSTTGWIVK